MPTGFQVHMTRSKRTSILLTCKTTLCLLIMLCLMPLFLIGALTLLLGVGLTLLAWHGLYTLSKSEGVSPLWHSTTASGRKEPKLIWPLASDAPTSQQQTSQPTESTVKTTAS